MPRPFTDITTAISSNLIKNGSSIVSAKFTGFYNVLNTYTLNTPTISDIENKYGNKFYNGIFVQLVGDPTVVGGWYEHKKRINEFPENKSYYAKFHLNPTPTKTLTIDTPCSSNVESKLIKFKLGAKNPKFTIPTTVRCILK